MFTLIAAFFRSLFRLLYGFEVQNPEVVGTPGPVLLLPNHISWWDWILVGCCLAPDWRFVTSSKAAQTTFLQFKAVWACA